MEASGTEGERRERPTSLAGIYLDEALGAVEVSGNAARLFEGWRSITDRSGVAREEMAIWNALQRRLTYCRNAILFAALAAEAYVNEFLAAYEHGADLKALDRLSTVDKYVVGTRIALGEPLFERGKTPMQTIVALFTLRNRLVHPKPGDAPPSMHLLPEEPLEPFSPNTATRYVVHVAAAASIMVRRAWPDAVDFPADVIWYGRKPIIDYARRAHARLPDRLAEPEIDLIRQALRASPADAPYRRARATPQDETPPS